MQEVNAQISMCCCHVQANQAARQAQAQLLMSRLAAAASSVSSGQCNGASSAADKEPLVVLCGDFNDSPASPACQVCHGHCLINPILSPPYTGHMC